MMASRTVAGLSEASAVRSWGSARSRGALRRVLLSLALLVFASFVPQRAAADQGGLSFWLPGAFGSLAATPLQPGWSLGTIYLHVDVSGGGDVAASRAIRFPNRTVNLNINLDATLQARTDIVVVSPTYVFPTPLFGGQFAVSLLMLYGRGQANIDANIAGALGPLGFATERSV